MGAKESTTQSIKQSSAQTATQSITRSTTQSMTQSARLLTTQSTTQSMTQSTSKWKVEAFQKYLETQLLTNLYPPPIHNFIKTKSRKPIKLTNHNVQEIVLHAEPSDGNIENVVSHEDGRKPVRYSAKWPNSVHGVIAVKFEGVEGRFFSTGTLIGPHIVLTAGHNLYNPQYKAYAQLESIQFLPGIDVQMLPFGIAEVERYFVSPNYVAENKEDYGILILKEPIGEMTGYFGLVCPKPEELTGRRVNVTGYPRDKVKSKPNTYEMWGMEGPAAHIDQQKGLIQYPIDTAGGQSGSGVWYQEGEEYYVCGIHQGGNSTYNQATLLTKSIYQQIHIWLQEIPNKKLLQSLGGTKFKVNGFQLDNECRSFLMAQDLDGLTAIYFICKTISTEGAAILAQNTSWVNLSQLDLAHNNISAQGAIALARNTSWTNLLGLGLWANIIGDQGAAALARNISWVNLSHLDLTQNNIGDQGVAALAQNTSWTKLSYLNLRENNFRAQGVSALSQNTSWSNLLRLNLIGNNIGDQGATILAQNTTWINLSRLDLSKNDIGDQGTAALVQNPHWKPLSINNIYC